jgi:cellulose synthase/poly-beta-1,6-N-acetylglucosamine synthase-like glycosyltransferase
MASLILNVLTVVHFLAVGGLALYGIHRIWMMYCWRRCMRTAPAPEPDPEFRENLSLPDILPRVTVQLPLYNESLVAGRLLDAVAAFDWPTEKLEIQVLDDSTDHTRQVVDERVAYWSARGMDIYAVRRQRRSGYKAGALANGLERAKGELIAVFDADFVPRPDFLQKMVPHFTGPDIGMVQAKWGFLNAGYSWLTRLQSLLLSTHFGIEHEVRFRRGLFFNFNGTAGIWRKTTIKSAGGWSSDTVTEDLDLSYRAQMAGWRFGYANDVVVPSELPVTLSDFRRQQERWGKGAIQTAGKLLPKLMLSAVSPGIKIEAAAHLLANFCWIFAFAATITLFPVLLNRVGIGIYQILWFDVPLFLLTGIAVICYYLIYGWRACRRRDLWVLPLLPAASIGLAPFFSLAVIKGLTQKGGVFLRTPKFGITDGIPAIFQTAFQTHGIINLMVNLPLLLYTLVPVIFAWHRGTWPAIPFLCFFPLGFCIVMGSDLQELLRMSRKTVTKKPEPDARLHRPFQNQESL